MGSTDLGGIIFRPTKMLVFAIMIVFLKFLGLRVKTPGGVKVHKMGTSETVLSHLLGPTVDIYNSIYVY